jgi:hypothetical protein
MWRELKPDKLPRPNQGYCLLIRFKDDWRTYLFDYNSGVWINVDLTLLTEIEFKPKNATYKLVKTYEQIQQRP